MLKAHFFQGFTAVTFHLLVFKSTKTGKDAYFSENPFQA